MSDYTTSKKVVGAITPMGAVATPFGRLEPLIKPEQLVMLHLFGIPLMSRTINPITKRADVMTSEMIKEYIHRAVGEIELATSITIMPVQYEEKLPYSRQDWDQFGFMQLSMKPITSIDSFTVQLADGGNIFNFPMEWIDTANLMYGQLNLIPLAYQSLTTGNLNAPGTGLVGFAGNGVFFNNLWNKDWVPALFNVTYTCGWPDGQVPTFLNELIGIHAAMRVLSMLGATNARNNSQSLAVDALSQSISGPGPQIYVQRMADLKEQKDVIMKKLRAIMNTNFVVTAI